MEALAILVLKINAQGWAIMGCARFSDLWPSSPLDSGNSGKPEKLSGKPEKPLRFEVFQVLRVFRA